MASVVLAVLSTVACEEAALGVVVAVEGPPRAAERGPQRPLPATTRTISRVSHLPHQIGKRPCGPRDEAPTRIASAMLTQKACTRSTQWTVPPNNLHQTDLM
jgi:hypothetical protein